MNPRLLATVIVLVSVLALPTGASALDRPTALENYLDILDAQRVRSGWTGNVDGCVVGEEQPASIAATATAVNKLREFAGVAPVTFDPALNRKALAAALMMSAKADLSHSPGPDWPCYSSEGAEAAGNSNLALGMSGANAVVIYTSDLGHRAPILNPAATTMGTGSTGGSNALYVYGARAADAPRPQVLAWPPAGAFPLPLIPGPWIATINEPGRVDVSQASVTVSVDGQPTQVTGLQRSGATVSWQGPKLPYEMQADSTVDVNIANVLINGTPRDFPYAITVFPVLKPEPAPFTATRSAGKLTIAWQQAPEHGVPVSAYRVTVRPDGEFDPVITQSADAQARELVVADPASTKRLIVTVTPQSRAGSPSVRGITVQPGQAAGRPQSTLVPVRARARLRLTSVRLRGTALAVRATIARAADGDTLHLVVTGAKRIFVRTARVVRGRVRIDARLPYRLSRTRPLRVILGYAGSARVSAAVARRTLRGRS